MEKAFYWYWSEVELSILERLLDIKKKKKLTFDDISFILNRSADAVKQKCMQIQRTKKRKGEYSTQEIAKMIELINEGKTIKEIAETIERPFYSVSSKISKLKIGKFNKKRNI